MKQMAKQAECEEVKLGGVHVERGDDSVERIDARKVSALTIIGDKVKGRNGKDLGKIEELMLDLTCGTIRYAVVSVGGFLGIGDKFFAIPLDALTVNVKEKVFHIDVDKKSLKRHHGFDKFNWPDMPEWPLDEKE